MNKIKYTGDNNFIRGITAKVNWILDHIIADVKVNGESVVSDNVASITVPINTSDLNNDSGFITNTVNNLTNYYLNTQTYTKDEVNGLIAGITTVHFELVQILPESGEENIIYLVPAQTTEPDNIYEEWIWISNRWECIGSTDIDLSNYVQKSLTVGLIKNDGTIDQTQYATMSDIPDELADLADDQTHRLVTDTEKSAWDAKADISDITSAINDLDVPSTSIGAGETLATIKEDNGKIAVTKQNISIKNNQIENYCMVGTASSISSGVTWHKVASTTLTIANDDAIIMFAVQDAYIPDTAGTSDSNGGILYCRVRQGSPVGTHNYGKLKFVANSGLDVNSFRLYYTITSGTSITYEIWTSLSRQYAFRKFVVLSQSNRYQAATEKWTLYNSTSPSSAPTESATCVRVECEDNTYKQTDNNLLGAKNLIPYPYSGGSNYVKNNVTISVNENGVISASGTAPSSGFGYGLSTKANPIILDPTKSYIMSGLNGGSSSKVRFLLDLWTASQNPVTDAYTTRLYEANGETTIPSGYKYLQITLYFYTGAASMFPLTVSPMLRLASIADSTFEPFAQTNRQLTVSKAEVTDLEDAYTDVYNLLHQPYYDQIENKISYRGVTWEVGSDNVKISGTATGGNSYYVFRSWQDGYCPNKNEVYHLEGCPSGGSTNSYYLVCQFVNSSGTTISYAYDLGNGVDFVLPYGTAYIGIIAYVRQNYAISGTKTVAPKLTVANKYASSNVASVEWTNNATKAYEVGDYMVWKNKLFIVRAAISSGGAITLGTNVVSTDIGIELKKAIEWKPATGGTIPESGSSNKVYIASKYAKELYISQIFLFNTTLGINVAGFCSLTVPLPEDSASSYYVYFFRGDTDNKLYDGRLLIKKDSTGVYGYVSQVFQDGVNLGASGFTATLYVYEKS